MLSPKGIHEIYFQTRAPLEEFIERLRATFNWPATNPGEKPQLHHEEEEGTTYYAIQTLGIEFCVVPNIGPFYIKEYHNYQIYMFIRWNAVDREPAKKLYGPLLTLLGNLLYRSGYEIEVDSILIARTRDEIKKNDPVMEIESDLKNENLLGL